MTLEQITTPEHPTISQAYISGKRITSHNLKPYWLNILVKISNLPNIHSVTAFISSKSMVLDIDAFDITTITLDDIGKAEELLNSEGLMLDSISVSPDQKNTLLTINF